MFEYRQVLACMRQGDSDRDIASALLMGRGKLKTVRQVALSRGRLDRGRPLPEGTELAAIVGRNPMMIAHLALSLEFKLEAVRLVKAGQSVAAVAATLDAPAQSISNWLKAEQEGKLGGAGTKPVSPEQMELSRLRAEVARLKMERDIVKKALEFHDVVDAQLDCSLL